MNPKEEARLLRSLLFVPGHQERYLESAARSGADVLILDIEDSVPPPEKKVARELIKKKIKSGLFANREIVIRINSRETNLIEEDLEATIWPGVSGIMPTKSQNKEDIQLFDSKLADLERARNLIEGELYIIPLIENPAAVLNAYSIATASTRVVAIAFGSEDFIAELQGKHTPEVNSLFVPRALTAMAARAADCEPIDTVYLDIRDLEGFAKQVELGRELGFCGTLVLHPCQVEVAHKYFTPTDKEVEESKEILAAVGEAQEAGYGITLLDGQLVGPPMVKRSLKVMEMVKRISKKQGQAKADS